MFESRQVELIAELAKTVLDEPTPDLFVSHIATKVLSSVECTGAILGIIQREGFLDLKGAFGYPDNDVSPYRRIPLWTPLPITEAARSGTINIFNSPQDLIRAYPSLAEFKDSEGVTVSAPIKFRNTVIGAIGFTSKKAPNAGFETNPVTDAVLSLCGLYVRNFIEAREPVEREHALNANTLTARQKQIIRLFEMDLTTDQMADRLRYSPSTIKQDIIRIYDIFGVNTRQAVVELARKAGLIETLVAN